MEEVRICRGPWKDHCYDYEETLQKRCKFRCNSCTARSLYMELCIVLLLQVLMEYEEPWLSTSTRLLHVWSNSCIQFSAQPIISTRTPMRLENSRITLEAGIWPMQQVHTPTPWCASMQPAGWSLLYWTTFILVGSTILARCIKLVETFWALSQTLTCTW